MPNLIALRDREYVLASEVAAIRRRLPKWPPDAADTRDAAQLRIDAAFAASARAQLAFLEPQLARVRDRIAAVAPRVAEYVIELTGANRELHHVIAVLHRDYEHGPTDPCPFCARPHNHGRGDGHRGAHCPGDADPNLRQAFTHDGQQVTGWGYYLRTRFAVAAATKGTVYFITTGAKSHGEMVKIGHTRGPVQQRLRDLQTANPDTLTCAASIPHDAPADLEKRIHARLSSYRARGEWFRLPRGSLRRIAKYTMTRLPPYPEVIATDIQGCVENARTL